MEFHGNNDYTANTEFKINILLGKNGYGKSTALKAFEQSFRGQEEIGAVKYITPERGGKLQYEPDIEHSITNNVNWLYDTRRVNRFERFRQQSVAQFRKLELLALREIEKDANLRANLDYTFDSVVEKINALLENVEVRRSDAGFKLYNKQSGEELNPDVISSGESELISLAVECLVFFKECEEEKVNALLFDEPDVHLHPDLQAKLMRFISDLIDESGFYVFIATHSTAIVGALDSYNEIGVHLMENRQKNLQFRRVLDIHRKILPVFGAHPLSSLFNKSPIFLVEGEDDVRIWQQAVRSSHGKLAIYPCSADGIDNLPEWENEVTSIIDCVYDDATAYSLRDRDENDGQIELEDSGPLVRLRLVCRAAENLVLSDEVLAGLGTSWGELKRKIDHWIKLHAEHNHYTSMCEFRDSGYDSENFDLKEIRNDLMGIIGSAKPWEVAIGQVIGKIIVIGRENFPNLCAFLGEKVTINILDIANSEH